MRECMCRASVLFPLSVKVLLDFFSSTTRRRSLRATLSCRCWLPCRITKNRLIWPKPLAIFSGTDEGLDHLGAYEIAIELIELRQPEVISGVISVRAFIRIAPEVTEILHEHEVAIHLG